MLPILIYLPLKSTLSPYTTLFRSPTPTAGICAAAWNWPRRPWRPGMSPSVPCSSTSTEPNASPTAIGWRERSEEHTSELQSRRHLVFRLLLENKIIKQRHDRTHRH